MKSFPLMALALIVLCSSTCLVEGATITVDENGNAIGTVGRGFLAPDPGPGGLASVLTYQLPFAGVQGDVGLQDGVGGPIFDYIRFNGTATLVFYSDNLDGFDAMADTASPPGALYGNQIIIQEVGSEGNNGATYIPSFGQPGFNPAGPTTYNFISDGTAAVPESATLLLVGSAAVAYLSKIAWRRRRR